MTIVIAIFLTAMALLVVIIAVAQRSPRHRLMHNTSGSQGGDAGFMGMSGGSDGCGDSGGGGDGGGGGCD